MRKMEQTNKNGFKVEGRIASLDYTNGISKTTGKEWKKINIQLEGNTNLYSAFINDADSPMYKLKVGMQVEISGTKNARYGSTHDC